MMRSEPKTGCGLLGSESIARGKKSERPVASSTREGFAESCDERRREWVFLNRKLHTTKGRVDLRKSSIFRIDKTSPRPNCTYASPSVSSTPGEAYVTKTLAG